MTAVLEWMQGMSPMTQALVGTLFTWLLMPSLLRLGEGATVPTPVAAPDAAAIARVPA